MKPLFKNLLKPLRGTFLTLLFTVPQRVQDWQL